MRVLVAKKVVYDRETLFEQVWEEPIVKVAEKYGVSDVMIHKYCRKLNVPTPPAGYWRKKEMGCKVPKKPKLPKFKGLPKIVGTGRFEEEVPDQVIVKEDGTEEHVDPYRLSDELEEKCRKAASSVEIVARRKWHPVVEKHMVAIAEWSKNHRTDPLAKCGEQPWEWHPYPAPALWEQITVRSMTKLSAKNVNGDTGKKRREGPEDRNSSVMRSARCMNLRRAPTIMSWPATSAPMLPL